MSILVVTDDATYEWRKAGVSNTGTPLTEVRKGTQYWVDLPDLQYGPWVALNPACPAPAVGERWLVGPQHGRWYFTTTVNEMIVGDL